MKHYDLIVIGGGPAGLMAAGRAAERGASVLLLEKNNSLGIKLLMTGGGRCNLTNKLSPRQLSEAYGANGRWFLSALTRFGSEQIIIFFHKYGLKTKVETSGRVFPQSDQANEVLSVLAEYAVSAGVEIQTSSPVKRIDDKDGRITSLILIDGSAFVAGNYIIATGGRSYPASGSTGDAYDWLRALGHRVVKPRAALTPILLQDDIENLQGISLNEIVLRLFQGDKRLGEERGDMIFTAKGISGPAVLSLSRAVARHPGIEMEIKIDFVPDYNKENLDKELQRLIEENKQLDIKNIICQLVPKKLASHILMKSDINPDKKGNGFTKKERLHLISMLKAFIFSIKGLRGFDEAMITAGGVDLREVDPKTMGSKKFENLYFAGEVLDLEGPTGGYNLQVAWSSGYIAGDSIRIAN